MKTSAFLLFSFISIARLFGQGWSEDLAKSRELTNERKFTEAIELIFNVIAEAKASKNDTALASAYIRIGSSYTHAEKEEIGLKYYQLARVLSLELGSEIHIAQATFGIAAIYQQSDKFDSARIEYLKATNMYGALGDSLTLSYLYSNISLMFSKMNQTDSMSKYSRMALEIQLALKDPIGAGASYSNLGLNEYKEGNFEIAINLFKKSISQYLAATDTVKYAGSVRDLALAYHKNETYDSASAYFALYDTLGHDLFHKGYENQILDLETKYKTAEIERNNAIQKSELDRRKNQLTLLILVIAFLVILSGAGYYLINLRRKRAKAITDQKISDLLQTQEMQTAYALLEGQDKERKRVALELHDNLGSTLVTLNMFADSLTKKTSEPKVIELAERISKTSMDANETVRQISHSLDSGLLKHFGLKAAVLQLSEAIESAKDMKVETHLSIEDTFDNEHGLEIYRMVQELFNNALKHGHASKIRIELTQVGKALSMIFEDNGRGFDPENLSRGMGLNNLEIRTEKLGGELEIDSNPGKGSTFIIDIPSL